MEYKILTSSSTYSLDHDVKTLIGEGWKPIGGVSSSMQIKRDGYNVLHHETDFHQAMIKKPSLWKRFRNWIFHRDRI